MNHHDHLTWISNKNIKKVIFQLLTLYKESLQNFNWNSIFRNVIDPVKMTFDQKFLGKEVKDLIETEVLRQLDKTRNNAIGYFHQNIFRYVKGWKMASNPFDVVNEQESIFVEVKNKFNTMNSTSKQRTMTIMLNKIKHNSAYKCFLVQVITKKSHNRVWTMLLDGRKIKNERIRIMSIDQFYKIATNQQNSFVNLLNRLPDLVDEVMREANYESIDIREMIDKNLPDISDTNFLTEIYKKAFHSYLGCEKLKPKFK